MPNYKINEEKMFADITDDVAIIINNETGVYYGMNGFGTSVFENLMNGTSSAEVLEKLKSMPNIPSNIEDNFNIFITALLEKELLIPSNEEISGKEIKINEELAISDEFSLSVREYNDAQELLLADPIHEVKEETGWLPEKEALNTDLQDVERREAKMKE
jgi:hypothetical protein